MKKSDFIKNIPVLSKMSTLELEAVAEFLEPRLYSRGSVLFREGDAGSELYIVSSGKIGQYSISTDGRRQEQKPLVKGSLFGEMALVEGERRTTTCYALTDSKILVLSGLNFFRMVWDYPMLGVKLLRSMATVMIERLAKASVFLDDMVRWGEIARRRAVSDDLSGLFNRRFLEETIHARFSRGFSDGRRCSLLMIDFDKFRDINLEYGTLAGDAVITNAGATIARIVGENCIPSRLSGDEFAIFLPDRGIESAVDLACRLQQEIASLYLVFRKGRGNASERVALTISVGAAACPDDAATVSALFDAADKALYRAKQNGRNQVCRAEESAACVSAGSR